MPTRFVRQLLNALGYNASPRTLELDRGPRPLLARVNWDQQPYLWVVEAFDPTGQNEDVMTLPVDATEAEPLFTEAKNGWWMKYSFSGRRHGGSWCCLWISCCRSIAPGGRDAPVAEVLPGKSWAHNQGISGSLRYVLRTSVELLSWEYDEQFPDADTEAPTNDCLRYLYRLLILVTVEARQQLGYLPMNAPQYREGLSLEKLRDPEFAHLHEENASEGFFIHDSLMEFFELVYQGRSETGRQRMVTGGLDTFSVAPLRRDLFDLERTSLLSLIRIRKVTWQQIS